LKEALEGLEPDEAKVSRPVLRGPGPSNGAWLLGEQLMLFSDRTSTHYLRSNQLRLYFSSIAYVLLQMLRRLGLEGTELAKAQCATIRLKLLKIGALIRITVRKVWISLAGGYPYVALFRQIHEKLCAVPVKY
jgi:hypothetical protein